MINFINLNAFSPFSTNNYLGRKKYPTLLLSPENLYQKFLSFLHHNLVHLLYKQHNSDTFSILNTLTFVSLFLTVYIDNVVCVLDQTNFCIYVHTTMCTINVISAFGLLLSIYFTFTCTPLSLFTKIKTMSNSLTITSTFILLHRYKIPKFACPLQ